MPNTLVHFGIQGVASRKLIPGADLKWIFLGSVLPDVPWILLKGLRIIVPAADPYALQLYAIPQASLAVTLALCGALALLATRPLLVFAILSFNSFLHLVLDGLETKWGNGVHLLAPFSWELWNAGWVWPNSPLVVTLTGFGLGYFLWQWRRHPPAAIRLPRTVGRYVGAAVLLALYFLLPLPMRKGPAGMDNHFVSTLRAGSERAGRYVEFDRNIYLRTERGGLLITFAGDTLRLLGDTPERSQRVSLKGRFTSPDTVVVYDAHADGAWFRNGASYLGLSLLGVLWLSCLSRRRGVGAGEGW